MLVYPANAGMRDRMFKRRGLWVSENAKDGYVKDNLPYDFWSWWLRALGVFGIGDTSVVDERGFG